MTIARRLPRLVAGLALVLAGCALASTDDSPATRTPVPSIGAGATATPTGTAGPSRSQTPSAIPSVTAESTPRTAIVPGAVDRSSLEVTATYDVELDISVDTGAIAVATVIVARNDSGSGIDRLDLNTVAARLGELQVTGAAVDGHAVTPEIDD
ncbi:MAG TPA: hypothetical protein VLS28_04465, partial [Candidatus Sulfomarinibacteraceae bacterium]|nr:hypothetical protein [Candidatus Sulfomarinibacteraceae bacterium]